MESQLVCVLGAIILFGKRRISSFFGPGNLQQLSCGQMCPWVLVLGLVVFAEVKFLSGLEGSVAYVRVQLCVWLRESEHLCGSFLFLT